MHPIAYRLLRLSRSQFLESSARARKGGQSFSRRRPSKARRDQGYATVCHHACGLSAFYASAVAICGALFEFATQSFLCYGLMLAHALRSYSSHWLTSGFVGIGVPGGFPAPPQPRSVWELKDFHLEGIFFLSCSALKRCSSVTLANFDRLRLSDTALLATVLALARAQPFPQQAAAASPPAVEIASVL
jgi:hypothetical protein